MDDTDYLEAMKHGWAHERAYRWHVALFIGSTLAILASFVLGSVGAVAAGLLSIGSGIMALRAGRSIIGWVQTGSATVRWMPEPNARGSEQLLHAYAMGVLEILFGIGFIVLWLG